MAFDTPKSINIWEKDKTIMAIANKPKSKGERKCVRIMICISCAAEAVKEDTAVHFTPFNALSFNVMLTLNLQH